MAISIKLSLASQETEEILSKKLKLDNPTVLRLALAKGLKDGLEEPPKADSKGREVPLDAIVKDMDLTLFNALITERVGRPIKSEEMKHYYKRYIDYGFSRMRVEFEGVSEDYDYLLKLAGVSI